MGRRQNRGEEFTRFPISKPYGYLPTAVEETIDEYETVIGQLQEIIENKDIKIVELQTQLKKAQNELRSLHLEMANIELPSSTDMAEGFVLNQFKNMKSSTAPTPVGDDVIVDAFPDSPMAAPGASGGKPGGDDEAFLDDIPIVC